MPHESTVEHLSKMRSPTIKAQSRPLARLRIDERLNFEVLLGAHRQPSCITTSLLHEDIDDEQPPSEEEQHTIEVKAENRDSDATLTASKEDYKLKMSQ